MLARGLRRTYYAMIATICFFPPRGRASMAKYAGFDATALGEEVDTGLAPTAELSLLVTIGT